MTRAAASRARAAGLRDATRHLRRRLQRTPLAAKLALLSAALTAGVVGVTFAVLIARTGATTRALYAEELGREQRVLLNLRREGDQQLVSAAALVAESPTLRSAVGTSRFDQGARAELARTVERELERMAPDLGRDLVAVTDADGRLFAAYAAGGAAPDAGVNVGGLPAVHAALDPALDGGRGDQYLSVLRVGQVYYHVGVAPLVIDGFTLGTVLLGERIDAAHAVAVGRSLGGQVVLTSAGRPIASTLAGATAATLPAAADAPRPMTAGGVEYVAASLPVGTTQDGDAVRMTLLQPVTPAVRRDTVALLRDFLLCGMAAVLLAGLGAAAVARTVLEPLQLFVRALRSGARGGGTGPTFDADSVSVEVRALDESFTQLMSSLAMERGELERRGAELSAANAVLTAEIADRVRVERALRESETQLRQSQKLEAVGTLAGGVAHDFNNLLTVISGYTQLAVMRAGKDSPAAEDLAQVVAAADHAGVLTQQLLAFSRKQVMQPRVLDLGDAVAGVEGMLRRLIGAHIELVVDHDGRPTRVKADPGQLEQVLMNLAVNARDAMSTTGGTLTISLGEGRLPNGAPAVLLTVRDTGTGMPADVRDRVFEPFFTTKAPGKGTGLGLSTVYGIVAQSGGTVHVKSEPGAGTAFVVALPAVGEAAPVEAPTTRDDTALPRGTETVLLVEDTDAVRTLAARVLETCGYTVLAAHSGVEALDLVRHHDGTIDLLLTDVVMPGVSGPQLAERLAAVRAGLCVMYMSGYAEDAILQFELDPTTAFLRKPFTPLLLARAVRGAIDAHRAEPLAFLR